MEENREKGLAARILRKEILILMVGLFVLGSGFVTGEMMQYFWGVTIILGAVGLHFVRKKDWKKHWEEQEQMMAALEERRRREREGKQ